MATPALPPSDEGGPDASDASLRAALENERLNAAHLRTLADRQQALLRRRSVRAVLSLDRRVRAVRSRAGREARRGRRRLARVRLVLAAAPSRSTLDERRRALAAARRALPPVPTGGVTVTVLVVAEEGPAVVPPTTGVDAEVLLLVTDRGTVPVDDPGTRVVRAEHKTAVAAVRDAARHATGDLLCITRSTTEPLEEGWLARLAAAVTGDVVAAVPTVLHPARSARAATPHDLLVRAAGLDIATAPDGRPEVRARAAGEAPDPTGAPVDVASGSSAGVVVRTDRYLEAGGLGGFDDLDAALVDLGGRLRAGGGRVVVLPSSLITDHRPVRSVAELGRPIDRGSRDWGHVLDRQPTTLTQLATHRPVTEHLLVRVTVAAPSRRVAHRWGDWHLAEGLAGGLRRRGHTVHLQTLGDLDPSVEEPGDVQVVLRGAARVPRTGRARRVLWIISHPESVTTEECDEADLVLVASDGFAADLRRRTATPVEVMLQATDPHRFSRRDPDPAHAHAVAVVAMTRHVFRPAVRDALDAGLRPAIYGSDWRDLVDPRLIVAPYVHNHRLPVVYSSIGVLLNDHWDTMRGWGFVSNRLFDALACETPIVSDHLDAIPALFGDAVATYDGPEALRAAVDAALDDPRAARARAAAGRGAILGAHTFAHRADELIDHLTRHSLVHLR